MNIDKISKTTIVFLIFSVALAVISISLMMWFSYKANQPLMIYGREFGFGTNELKKRTEDLLQCRSTAENAANDFHDTLEWFKAENSRLKAENSKWTAEYQARARRDAEMWYPVSDIDFVEEGTFTTSDGKEMGKGAWKSSSKDLTLKLLSSWVGEVVLETNLNPPSDRIRLDKNAMIINANVWQYRVYLLSSYSDRASVRVERRGK
jgi:hypothetical protein